MTHYGINTKNLRANLVALQAQRTALVEDGWHLQHCWLVQVKPGGTARTDRHYWQVRSRFAMFDGKKLKHLKADEVEAYRAAIERGHQLQQVDLQIRRLQRRLALLSDAATPAPCPTPAALVVSFEQTEAPPAPSKTSELVHKSRSLRASLQESIARYQILAAEHLELQHQSIRAVRESQERRQLRQSQSRLTLSDPASDPEGDRN